MSYSAFARLLAAVASAVLCPLVIQNTVAHARAAFSAFSQPGVSGILILFVGPVLLVALFFTLLPLLAGLFCFFSAVTGSADSYRVASILLVASMLVAAVGMFVLHVMAKAPSEMPLPEALFASLLTVVTLPSIPRRPPASPQPRRSGPSGPASPPLPPT